MHNLFTVKNLTSSIIILMSFMLMNKFHFITDKLIYSLYLVSVGYGFLILTTKKQLFFRKEFLIFHFMILVNLISLVLVPSFQSLQYFVVKFGLFTISMGAIYNYRDYYIYDFPTLLKKVLLFALFLSVLMEPNIMGDGTGYKGIYGTRNELGLIASLTFALILIEKNFTKTNVLLLLFCLALALLSTSRAAIVGILIAFIIAGFSWKKIVLTSLLALSAIYLTSFLGIKSGLNRLESENAVSGREWEFIYGMETIKKEPLTGWGLDKYAFIDKDVVSLYHLANNFVLNPHNSYIGAYTQYGVIFATLIFLILFYFVLKIMINKNVNSIIKLIIVFTMINGIVETYLFSISGLPGFLFWFYLGIGISVLYEQKSLKRNSYE